MTATLTDSQRETLRVFCDTIVPRIERADDPNGHYARAASDLQVADGVAEMIAEVPDPEVRAGLGMLIDALVTQGFTLAPSQASREQILRNIAFASPDGAAGIGALTAMTLFLYYGAPDPPTGVNANWATFGYPGPPGPPPQVPKAIETIVPDDGQTMEADAVVVGSGAGGAVVAAGLAGQGKKVVVIEAGGYFNESDFLGYELPAYESMFWRGGPTPTADLNVSLQAGTTLGGGTTINWMNCLRTKPWVRSRVGRARARGRRRRRVRPPPRRGARAHRGDRQGERPRRAAAAHEGGRREARLALRARSSATPTSRSTRTRRPATSASATSPARSCRPRRPGCATPPRTAPSSSSAAGRRRVLVEDGRAAGVEAIYTGDDGTDAAPADRARADRRGRLRGARVAGAAAPLGHRRARGRQLPAPAPGGAERPVTTRPTRRRSSARPHAGLVDEFAGVERRLRLPRRGRPVRARPDRRRARRGPAARRTRR